MNQQEANAVKTRLKLFAIFAAATISLSACSLPKEAPLVSADPAEIKPVYDGELYQHEFIYENERDRGWEKDIVALADRYLQEHPKISGRIFPICLPDESRPYRAADYSDWERNIANIPLCFDEDLQREFISETDALIRDIPELTDLQVWYRAIKLAATLKDIHSYVEYPFFEKTLNGEDKEILPLSPSDIRKQRCPAGTAKRRIIAQSRQIQGGGSHALLYVMQEPPTQKLAALS